VCLAVPCEVVQVAGRTALVSVDGALREVDVSLVDGVHVGGYLLVHAGFALECWSERDVSEWKAMLDGTWSSRPGPGEAS
jgi:hydrogenase expression/formation protein HypC